jgi:hypothetical protein
MALMEVFSGLIFIMAVLLVIRRRIPVFKLGPDYFLWGFFIIVALGALTLPDLPWADRFDVIGDARFVVLLYSLAVALSFCREQWGRQHSLLFALAGLVAIYASIQFFTGIDVVHSRPYQERIGEVDLFRAKGFFTNTMSYSYVYGMILCFLAGHLAVQKKRPKWQWAAAVLMGISLVLTFTRGLWIALAVTALFMSFLVSRKLFMQVAVALVVLFRMCCVCVFGK